VRALVGTLCAAAAILLSTGPSAFAARAQSDIGTRNPIIIWDGSSDVPVSNGTGDGFTSPLSLMRLASLADYAVLVSDQVPQGFETETPIDVIGVRVFVGSEIFAIGCGAHRVPTPLFCARIQRLDEVVTRPTRDFLGATARPLPVVGLDLVPGELPLLWRFAPAEQAVLAEIIQVLGGDNIRLGFEGNIAKTSITQFRRIVLRDLNLPTAFTRLGVDSVAPAIGTVAGGLSVTITGSNFRAGASVTLGGVPASNVIVVDSSTITATIGSHAPGAVDGVVTNPDANTARLPAAFSYVPDLSNDHFANRFPISGFGSHTAMASGGAATAEPSEPSDLIGVGQGTPSLWWTWTAPCSFEMQSPNAFIDTVGSDFDTVVGVFTGST
jgi:hypothetical protein